MDMEAVMRMLCERIAAESNRAGYAEAKSDNARWMLERDNRALERQRDRYLVMLDKIEDALTAAGPPARAVAAIRVILNDGLTPADRTIPRPLPF